MALGYKLKHHLFNAFRELFVYHHSSLEFRAKLFALIISVSDNPGECDYEIVKTAGMQIYNEEDRANTLALTTEEYVERVRGRDSLEVDTLIQDITQDLKIIPRYSKKINIGQLTPLLGCSSDEDTIAYQKSIIAFLEQLKRDYE
jgi:hypothetical protein